MLDLPGRAGTRARRRDAHDRAGCVAAQPGDRLDGLGSTGLERGESVLAVDNDFSCLPNRVIASI